MSETGAWLFTFALLIVTLLLLGWNSRWHLLQGVIFMAVVASNIHWGWTDNGYVAVLIGAVCAYVVSALALKLIDAKWRGLLGVGQQCLSHLGTGHQGGKQGLPQSNRIAQRNRHLLRTDRR